jgi:hypothetical protein
MELVIFFKTSSNISKINILNTYSSSVCLPSYSDIFILFYGDVHFEKLHFVRWSFTR